MSQSNDRPDQIVGRIVLGTSESGQTYASGFEVGISLEDVKTGLNEIATAIRDTPLGEELRESGRLPDHLIGEADLSDRARFHEVRRQRVDELEEKFRTLYTDIEMLDKYDGVDQSAAWLARNSIIGGLHILRSAFSGSVSERPVEESSLAHQVIVKPFEFEIGKAFNADGSLSEYGRQNCTISQAKITDGEIDSRSQAQVLAGAVIDERSQAERDIDDCK
jgi:hypothetical protein